MKRRAFVLGLGALATGVAACAQKRTVKSVSYGDLECLELTPAQPDPTLPVLVALHANGGAPEHWVQGFAKFPGRCRVVLPRSFTPGGWFTNEAGVEAAEERLARGLGALAAGRRLAVCGYTEGATLSFVLARRPSLVLGAFGIAGACPRALYPKTPPAPIALYLGLKDATLDVETARATVAAWKSAGGEATLREYAGVEHDPSDKVHADLDADVVKTLEAGRSPRG